MLDQTPQIPDAQTARTAGRVVIRIAGDSGDGIQTIGGEFTKSTALDGSGLMTFPDFPAEIRAPAGTTFGVSAFQIQFGGERISTHGDEVDVLVALNPAALKAHTGALRPGGKIIADAGTFQKRNLEKAGYAENPLETEALAGFDVHAFEIGQMVRDALEPLGVSKKESDRARNFWALGLLYWMYGRPLAPTAEWLERKYAKRPEIAEANTTALKAGHAFGENLELEGGAVTHIEEADFPEGLYRTVTGTDACVYGLAAVAALSGVKVQYCSYPITPASAMLHGLARIAGNGISTFQAEDEIAAACAALGASYAGSLGVTGTSGPGVALKAETLGLAVAAELPMIVIDVQRAGPSTGLPTKTEQSDLTMAVHGRHGEAPMPVLAPAHPAECFDIMIEAAQIAMTHMTPVMVLTDGYVANASEPWMLPDTDALPDLAPAYHTDAETFQPFNRDADTLARPWAKPGTPGLAHRIGGIERSNGSGHISYDAANHQTMTDLRAEKMQRVRSRFPVRGIDTGVDEGDVLVIGWGSTYGALREATQALVADGHKIGHMHVREVFPLPPDLADIAAHFKHVLVCELNTGQLKSMIRDELLIDAQGFNQVSGQPFAVEDIKTRIRSVLS